MKYKTLESVIRSRPQTESAYKSFRNALASIYEQVKKVETHFKDQIVVGQYRTFNFEMCPAAQLLYSDLPVDVDRNAAERTAQILDQLFALEKSVVASEKATDEDIKQAQVLADKAMSMAKKADLEKEHSFVQKHVENIKKFHKVEDLNPKTGEVTADDIKKKFTRPSLAQTPEPRDMDIDNQKFRISRNLRMQRKLKIIDND